MPKNAKMGDWFPRLEEYNPNITKDEWCGFVQDKTVFDENALITFACILKVEVATCADMAEQFGRNVNFYNNAVWQTGKKIHEKTNCPLSERSEGGNRFWPVCCLGKYLQNGKLAYKIRPELREAFEETKVLEGVEVMEKENISEMGKFKHLLEYFVSHLEWCENNNKSSRGYNDYIKPLIDTGKFIDKGHGYKGDPIQSQIKDWDKYYEEKICISASNYAPNHFKSKLNYLHWTGTWFNIRPEWNGKHIDSLYLTSQEGSNAPSNMKKSLSELELFNDDYSNFSKDFKEFFRKFMSYKNLQGATTMTDTTADNHIDLLKNTRNIIFHGAPGTGKTFLAKQLAAEMNAETVFVQFHPSYDYTDFVEGLRPTPPNENGQIGFERKDGVFKEFCKQALKNLQDSQKSVEVLEKEMSVNESIENFLEKSIDEKTEFETATGNKFFVIESSENSIFVSIPANEKTNKLSLPKNDLIGLLSSENEIISGGEVKSFFNRKWRTQQDSYIWILYKQIHDLKQTVSAPKVEKIEKKNFVFIIDEINRGDLSKIFGELFYSIEPGYRGKKGIIQTQYQNLIEEGDVFREGFFIPENVYIIGTMNDIDRSVETMDFAFRRRFTFKEITADSTMNMLDERIDENGNTTGLPPELAQEAKSRMINLNNAISEIDGFSSAYHIGGAYFLKLNELGSDFETLWNYHLEPLLKEYLRGTGNEEKLEELKAAYFKEAKSTEDSASTEENE